MLVFENFVKLTLVSLRPWPPVHLQDRYQSRKAHTNSLCSVDFPFLVCYGYSVQVSDAVVPNVLLPVTAAIVLLPIRLNCSACFQGIGNSTAVLYAVAVLCSTAVLLLCVGHFLDRLQYCSSQGCIDQYIVFRALVTIPLCCMLCCCCC